MKYKVKPETLIGTSILCRRDYPNYDLEQGYVEFTEEMEEYKTTAIEMIACKPSKVWFIGEGWYFHRDWIYKVNNPLEDFVCD